MNNLSTLCRQNLTSNCTDPEDFFGKPLRQGLVAGILAILCIATVVGNILVILAVFLVPKLQRPENLLIISLAIADELVGLVVMPVAMIYEVVEYWPFGRVFCDLWICLDITACSASILSLCVISLDRYFVISRPLQYGPKRTIRRMVLSVVLVWIVSAVISVPPLFYFGNQNVDHRCLVSQEPVYQIYATITAFYAPVLLMLIAYCKIYQAAAKISKEEKSFTVIQPILRQDSSKRKNFRSVPTEFVRMLLPDAVQQTTSLMNHNDVCRNNVTFQSRELKAIRTLTAIVVAFLISWMPFFVVALVRPFYGEVPKWVSATTLWLGFCNSTVNPVLYSIFNKDFRRPFAELLRCRCRSLRKIMRTESYEAQFGLSTQHSVRSRASPESRPQSRARFYLTEKDYDSEL